MEPTPVIAENPFAPSEFEQRKNRGVARRKWIMFGFCLALVVPLLRGAVACHTGMATFTEAAVENRT